MTQNVLNPDEFEKIESLNTVQIIETYPELVLKARENSQSFADMLRILGISSTNHRARKNIREFLESKGIDVPNYRLYQFSTEFSKNRSMTKEEVLRKFVKGDKHLGTILRKLVLKYNLLPYKCSTKGCMLSDGKNLTWNGKKIDLDLDHIDGDNTNNELGNLRWLCPNCHSQTETYKGKNRRIKDKPTLEKTLVKRREAFLALPDANSLWEEIKAASFAAVARKYNVSNSDLKIKLLEFEGEDELVTSITDRFRAFAIKRQINITENHLNPERETKADYPPVEDMVARILKEGYQGLARELGVDGNAIRKYLNRRLGYTPKRVKKSEQ